MHEGDALAFHDVDARRGRVEQEVDEVVREEVDLVDVENLPVRLRRDGQTPRAAPGRGTSGSFRRQRGPGFRPDASAGGRSRSREVRGPARHRRVRGSGSGWAGRRQSRGSGPAEVRPQGARLARIAIPSVRIGPCATSSGVPQSGDRRIRQRFLTCVNDAARAASTLAPCWCIPLFLKGNFDAFLPRSKCDREAKSLTGGNPPNLQYA
jgi:hypothetical protein